MSTKNVFITGDIANDYFLVRGKRFYSDDQNPEHKGTHYAHHRGGAYLIYKFLSEISRSQKPNKTSKGLKIRFGYKSDIFRILPDKNNGFVSVSQYEKIINEEKTLTWRIDEFLGFGDRGSQQTGFTKHKVEPSTNSDIFIVDDAGMDFYSDINKSIWNELIETIIKTTATKQDSLLIYKKSGDFDDNDFYNSIIQASLQKKLNLITILSINDIRKLDLNVSSGISWEQSASDLVTELNTNLVLARLLKSKYLIITFQSSGALFVVNNGQGNYEYTLIFDPDCMEGEDEDKDQGKIIGRMSFFTAAFASNLNLAKREKHYKIDYAVKAGLTAIRLFFKNGYIETPLGVNYPYREVAGKMKDIKEFSFSSSSVPAPDAKNYEKNREWSILIDNYSNEDIEAEVIMKSLAALAKNIVHKGPDILKNIPCGRFGKLFTIDRSEIESLRNLKKIMETYVNIDKRKKPLSIGVFGPPGAGKSFAVEEIGQGILGDKYHLLVFNLSQFNNPEDLIGALHQVRDCVLNKKTPVVFWDEFDSHSFMWLQYLLAPMQDGVFQEGQLTHPVGKCIFVFAGATSYNMNAFGKFNTENEEKEFILKKGPDFISRLNGYINILGPNKRQNFNPGYSKVDEKWIDDPSDFTYPIRRAIFIINLLKLKKDDFPLRMDWGLLNALIKVDRYKHGSRTMANLLNDIRQNNPRNLILRSWLPSKATMELHFKNPKDFYENMTRETDFIETAWEVAPIIHSYWCKKLNDPTKEYSVEYSFLPVFIKESNVQAAMRIPEVLKAGGFKLIKKDCISKLNESDYQAIISGNNFQLLKKMASKEHELWMKFYRKNGWHFSIIRNDYEKKHNCLIPYSKLPEYEKEKDKDLISNYMKIVDIAGFGIAKLE